MKWLDIRLKWLIIESFFADFKRSYVERLERLAKKAGYLDPNGSGSYAEIKAQIELSLGLFEMGPSFKGYLINEVSFVLDLFNVAVNEVSGVKGPGCAQAAVLKPID